jgi:hypothetical protein
MLGGISRRWKQVVSYHFTPDGGIVGKDLEDHIKEVVLSSENIGLNVVNVTADMGPTNLAVWKCLGIKSSKTIIQNSFKNPANESKDICFIADVPHLFKNWRTALLNNNVIELPQILVDKYKLPSNIVDVKYIKDLAEMEDCEEFKLVPSLSPEHFKLNHFNKMKVSLACHVLDFNVGASLEFLSNTNDFENFDRNALTTAWFVKTINKWFKLMTSRIRSLAISKLNLREYEETISFLKECIFLFRNLKISENKKWKPVQTGSILSTKSILDLQDYFLNVKGYDFLQTSRFSNDSLENLFGQARLKQNIPNALQFRNLLKNLCVAQFIKGFSLNGSYENADDDNLLPISAFKKPPVANSSKPIPTSRCEVNFNVTSLTLNDTQKNILYYTAGYVLKSLNLKCKSCQQTIFSKNFKAPYTKLLSLKQYKNKNCLKCASAKMFQLFVLMESVFIFLKNEIIPIRETHIDIRKLFFNALLHNDKIKDFALPVTCHALKTKILKRYSLYRVRVYLRAQRHKIRKEFLQRRAINKSSKSAGMRDLVTINFGINSDL